MNQGSESNQQEQFVKLLMANRSSLHGFVYGLVRDPHLTEDLLQDVAALLWAKFDRFEAGTEFGAWARAVAYRECLAKRRHQLRLRIGKQEVRAIQAAYERRDASVDTSSHREAMKECIRRLGETALQAVRWRYQDGLRGVEIANRLRRTPEAIAALLYRTRKTLADCIRNRLAMDAD